MLVVVCLAGIALASVATSYLLKPILNDYVIPGNFKGLLRMLLLQGGLFGLSAICSYTYARIMVHISQRAVAAIRKDLFA